MIPDVMQKRRWLYEQRASRAVRNLQKRNMNAQYVSSREEALSAVLDMIPVGATIVRGDSVTLEQVGIVSELSRRDEYKFIDPFERNADGSIMADKEEIRRRQRDAFCADVFLTSTNAVTLDGKLVSIDGTGGRVAATIFGPKKVIVVAGVNKIVKDVNEALARIQSVAAPMDGKQHMNSIPQLGDLACVRTGVCVDCSSEWRICRFTVIIAGNMPLDKGRINVVLVGEELGF